jgi:hypothetical protein
MAAPHISGKVALCLAAGRCSGAPSDVIARVRADAERENKRDRSYGFLGDPLRPVEGTYFGYLARASLY